MGFFQAWLSWPSIRYATGLAPYLVVQQIGPGAFLEWSVESRTWGLGRDPAAAVGLVVDYERLDALGDSVVLVDHGDLDLLVVIPGRLLVRLSVDRAVGHAILAADDRAEFVPLLMPAQVVVHGDDADPLPEQFDEGRLLFGGDARAQVVHGDYVVLFLQPRLEQAGLLGHFGLGPLDAGHRVPHGPERGLFVGMAADGHQHAELHALGRLIALGPRGRRAQKSQDDAGSQTLHQQVLSSSLGELIGSRRDTADPRRSRRSGVAGLRAERGHSTPRRCARQEPGRNRWRPGEIHAPDEKRQPRALLPCAAGGEGLHANGRQNRGAVTCF